MGAPRTRGFDRRPILPIVEMPQIVPGTHPPRVTGPAPSVWRDARAAHRSALGPAFAVRRACAFTASSGQPHLACALDARQAGKSFRHSHQRARIERSERAARDRGLTQCQGAITAAAVEPQALAACLTAGAWRSIDFGIAQTTPFIFATELYLAGLAG